MLADTLRELIDAAFTGLWVQTQEPDEAIRELTALSNREGYELIVAEPAPDFDPVMSVRALLDLPENGQTTLLVLPNYTPYLADPVARQSVYRAIQAGKTQRRFVLILSPVVAIPQELDKVMYVVEHALPTREDLTTIAQQIGTQAGELPEGDDFAALLDAAAGLTRYEAEGAFSLSLVQQAKITPKAVWQIKSGMLKKSGLLQLHQGTEDLDQIGGLAALKAYCLDWLRPGKTIKPRGVVLLGVPGTGKSTFAKALGRASGRPTLTLDIGALMTKFVGESGTNLRRALAVADAMSPCILFIDELEKALGGIGTDSSGVKDDIFGALLTWLAEHKSDVFTIATSNKLKNIPSAFTRGGRFNSTWFLDYPDQEQRAAIWPLYLSMFGLDPDQQKPDDERWTGGEIRACCEEAAGRGIPLTEAADCVIPVSLSGAAENEAMRADAAGKYLDANRGKNFSLAARSAPAPEQRRAVIRSNPKLPIGD